MSDPLFVVLGAGASHACTSEEYRREHLSSVEPPPLVKGLFSGQRARSVLQRYPQAEVASAAIRRAGSEALAIEDWIRENYLESPHEENRRRFASITYFLQDLLLGASDDFQNQPDNLDLLVQDVLAAFDRVIFITLNYDLLLDRRLSIGGPKIREFNDYLAHGNRGWSLIKLHGSVNWSRLIPAPHVSAGDPPADLPDRVDRDDFRFVDLDAGLKNMRVAPTEHGSGPTFPALAVPLGPDDELVCPKFHEEFLRQQIAESKGLDILMVGYSGNDRQVMDLLRGDDETPLRSLLIVDRDGNEAMKIQRQVVPKLGYGSRQLFQTQDLSFESFVHGPALRAYLELVRDIREKEPSAERWPLTIDRLPGAAHRPTAHAW